MNILYCILKSSKLPPTTSQLNRTLTKTLTILKEYGLAVNPEVEKLMLLEVRLHEYLAENNGS